MVAIAAGNSGPGAGTIQSPGKAEKVITAGASTNPHSLGIPVTVGASTFGAAVGQFANFVPAVTAAYTTTSPTNGCTTISQNLAGAIALIARGTCTFSTKIRNAQAAGAIGVIMSNNVFGDPVAMRQDGTPNQPTIPAVMVSNTNGAAMGHLAPRQWMERRSKSSSRTDQARTLLPASPAVARQPSLSKSSPTPPRQV